MATTGARTSNNDDELVKILTDVSEPNAPAEANGTPQSARKRRPAQGNPPVQSSDSGSATAQAAAPPTSAPEPSTNQSAESRKATAATNEQRLLDNWLTIQGINLTRHAGSLRPFTKDEFGTGSAAPGASSIVC